MLSGIEIFNFFVSDHLKWRLKAEESFDFEILFIGDHSSTLYLFDGKVLSV